MSATRPRPARGTLSLVLSVLALLIAMSGTAYAALADGSVRTRHLANRAVTNAKIGTDAVTSIKLARGAVTGSDLRDGAVTGRKVRDRSLGLRDLGGAETNQTTITGSALMIAAGACQNLSLSTDNPTPVGYLGSMVVGTVTTSAGEAVVDNQGAVLPTLLTETSQGGVVTHLTVCAGASNQTIPAGSIITWSLIRP